MTKFNEDNPPIKPAGCLFVRGGEHPEAQGYYDHYLGGGCAGMCKNGKEGASAEEENPDKNKKK